LLPSLTRPLFFSLSLDPKLSLSLFADRPLLDQVDAPVGKLNSHRRRRVGTKSFFFFDFHLFFSHLSLPPLNKKTKSKRTRASSHTRTRTPAAATLARTPTFRNPALTTGTPGSACWEARAPFRTEVSLLLFLLALVFSSTAAPSQPNRIKKTLQSTSATSTPPATAPAPAPRVPPARAASASSRTARASSGPRPTIA